jgi:hypothetical protein
MSGFAGRGLEDVSSLLNGLNRTNGLVLLVLVLVCGCISSAPASTTTSSTAAPATSTTLIVTTTTSAPSEESTSTTMASTVLPECDEKGKVSPYAGVICYDDYAIAHNDANYCKSLRCFAYVSQDASKCGSENGTSRQRECNALAARNMDLCKEGVQDDVCYRAYTLTTGDYDGCKLKEKAGVNFGQCAWIFARAHLDTSYCDALNTNTRSFCMEVYNGEVAVDSWDESYCKNIKSPQTVSACVRDVKKAVKLNEPRVDFTLLEKA